MINLIILLGIGYLAGCFQTAYIIGKTNQHIDIRQYGSGNAGTTNAVRVMGLKLGILTFVGDFLKGFVTVMAVQYFTGDGLPAVISGLGVILGHDFPVFLNFKGGKGIASTIGIAFALDYRAGLFAVGLMVIIMAITKYVSLASITLCLSLPVYFLIFHPLPWPEILVLSSISLLGVFQHRSNLKRLFEGTEMRISKKAIKK